MESPVAWSLFNGTDDLAFDLPEQGDSPAVQTWDMNPSGAPLSRQWVGNYSWIVSIAPTSNAAQMALASNPQSHAYDVSVVVFHKRGIPAAVPASAAAARVTADDLAKRERMVKAQIVSTGLNGGEVLLQNAYIPNTTDPFQELRTGQWIMLCGPHPASSEEEPRFAMNWYQVMAIDSEGAGITPKLDPVNQRVVSLRGPEWAWQPAANLTTGELSNNLCVGVFPGAVAVHKKTMRLEGPRGAAMGGGFTWGTAPVGATPRPGFEFR
jgi:hypothetical protein